MIYILEFNIRFNSILFSDPPQVILSFGASINTKNIFEGTDVYFECKIDANPPVYKVEWTKEVSVL